MGKRIGTDSGGRYEKGGQQVASLFSEPADNEKIKAIYGNYNFWSWLRYWYFDTENYVAWMLADKSYYDYDYSEPTKRVVTKLKPKSNDEIHAMMARFGFKTKLRTSQSSPMTAEEMQRIAMEEQNNTNND